LNDEIAMVEELEQFQKDLLYSVRQMKSKASGVTERSLSANAEGGTKLADYKVLPPSLAP